MKRFDSQEPRPNRRWRTYVAVASGLLFVSGFLEAVFAQSVVLLTAFVVWLLLVSLIGHLFGLWN